MNRIKFVSWFFRILFQISFLTLVVAHVLGWIYASNFNTGFFSVIPAEYQGKVFSPFTVYTRVIGFLVTSMPLVFQLLVLYSLIKLFRLYAEYKIFTMDNVRWIRNAGYALLLHQVAKPISDFAMGFVLTSSNPPGLHFATMQITDKNIMVVLTALMIILISWIMAEGCKLQEEHELTI